MGRTSRPPHTPRTSRSGAGGRYPPEAPGRRPRTRAVRYRGSWPVPGRAGALRPASTAGLPPPAAPAPTRAPRRRSCPPGRAGPDPARPPRPSMPDPASSRVLRLREPRALRRGRDQSAAECMRRLRIRTDVRARGHRPAEARADGRGHLLQLRGDAFGVLLRDVQLDRVLTGRRELDAHDSSRLDVPRERGVHLFASALAHGLQRGPQRAVVLAAHRLEADGQQVANGDRHGQLKRSPQLHDLLCHLRGDLHGELHPRRNLNHACSLPHAAENGKSSSGGSIRTRWRTRTNGPASPQSRTRPRWPPPSSLPWPPPRPSPPSPARLRPPPQRPRLSPRSAPVRPPAP